ncbi:RNA methyltransferase [Pusillimonas sp. ANT_WB101]|uniref:TrmH family RNA methyltransferase n=1 Tax=Pusillimonas sp. ANT_WB101 TaxID=2597356 RepID=UPI0011ECA017|nr:RNA methyltransferase [Pusillimonas sp. ANT_WB101]KAA0911000.1 RNA methyltransferase [Pusillimonas sp. ANT_WB101]
MKHISSRDNPLFKQLQRIAAGKRTLIDKPQVSAVGHTQNDAVPYGVQVESYDEGRPILLEGVHLCQAWLQHQGMPQIVLFDAERLAANTELQALASMLAHWVGYTCDPRLAHVLSQVQHGQGVFFVAQTPVSQIPARIEHNCIWLDRVQDPGNAGTLLRTAAAAGIQHAYFSEGCVAAWSPKVLRSAQGAHFVMAIYEHANLQGLRERLDIPLVATALEGAESLFTATLPARCAWLMGNEGQGASSELLALADLRVFIPQVAEVESLNVAVAAGICLFEQRRQALLVY